MYNLFQTCDSAIVSGTRFFATSPSCKYLFPSWGASFEHSSVRTVKFQFLLAKVQFQNYSSKRSGEDSSKKSGEGSSETFLEDRSRKKKIYSKPLMKDDKEAFFVVRKGDIVGVYKSLSDCQAQAGTSICDPPVSVYKGYNMPKDTEKHLMSCGLKNALYSIRASDITEELFGTLVSCPVQPASSRGETSSEPVTKKRQQEAMWSEYGETVGTVLTANDALTKHFKLDQNQSVCRSCTLEFDGASKGNPGQAGAGVILRSDDGNLICRLREGLGIATNNVAEYRAFILGMRYALRKGFTSVRIRGDSKLICMQIQGLWKVKNQNILALFDEAKKLKDKFASFQIIHVLRDLNSEADALANLAVDLDAGQIQEEIDK